MRRKRSPRREWIGRGGGGGIISASDFPSLNPNISPNLMWRTFRTAKSYTTSTLTEADTIPLSAAYGTKITEQMYSAPEM
jgi:hypothetical protein